MPRVTYRSAAGGTIDVDVPDGLSVMKAAINNRVPGIVGECGGSLQCATCHVYVDADNTIILPEVSDDEDEMLEATATARSEHSRLSCQLVCSESTHGLIVHTPETQY